MLQMSDTTEYRATLLLGRSFMEWTPGDPLVTAKDLAGFRVTASDEFEAAEKMFAVGNRVESDAYGEQWPTYVRSVSVGDVVRLTYSENGERVTKDLAVGRIGFFEVTGAPSVVIVKSVLDQGTRRLLDVGEIDPGEWE